MNESTYLCTKIGKMQSTDFDGIPSVPNAQGGETGDTGPSPSRSKETKYYLTEDGPTTLRSELAKLMWGRESQGPTQRTMRLSMRNLSKQSGASAKLQTISPENDRSGNPSHGETGIPAYSGLS